MLASFCIRSVARHALLLLALSAVCLGNVPAHSQSAASWRYYVAFLRPAPDRANLPAPEAERLQAAHMANIRKMAKDGVLVSAGPFEDNPTTISGLFLFKVESAEKAKSIAEQDPTVIAHRNTIDVHGWNGPEGIGEEYVRLHTMDPKTPENMQIHALFIVHQGASWNERSAERDAILKEHSAYIAVLRQQHKVAAAGRLAPSGDLFGMVIFQALPLEEARRLVEEDPAAKAGILRYEPHQWWSTDHVLPQ